MTLANLPPLVTVFGGSGFIGRHGTMEWMAETRERRGDPRTLWSDVLSVAVFGLNYGPDEDPRGILGKAEKAAISVYARNRDYHDVIKGRLKEIATRFAARAGADVKVFVDTAPVMIRVDHETQR